MTTTGIASASSQADPDLLTAVESLHRAVADASLWPEFLSSLCRAVRADAAVIVSLHASEKRGLVAAHRVPKQAVDQWLSNYQVNDPWLAAVGMPAPGEVTTYRGSDLIDSALLPRELRDGFLDPNVLGSHMGAWINPAAAKASPTSILLWRESGQPDFDSQDLAAVALLARLLSALERITIDNALSRAAGMANQQSAVYLLDNAGGIVISNQRGAELVELDTVRDYSTRVGFATSTATVWFSGLMGATDPNDGLRVSVDYRERLPGIGPVRMSVFPFAPIGTSPAMTGISFGLTIQETGAVASRQIARMATKMYRWTSAELDTVRRLADGYSVPDIARERSCSVETVRSHLKNAKRKAGVRRQVELVRLMISLQGAT